MCARSGIRSISADHLWALVLLIAASAIILANLGDCYLWGDEAQTALVSRTVLTHGIPMGTDGRNYFGIEGGAEYGKDHIWRWHPWLPFYVLAGFFAVFGQSTFVARLPFALFGIGAVVLVYYFGLSAWKSRRAGILAAVLLMTSVPMLLLDRQCRYYSMTAFFFIAGLYAYHRMMEGRRYSAGAFAASAFLLFHSLYIYVPALLAAVLAHATIYHRAQVKRIVLISAGVAAVNVPWIIYFANVASVYRGQRNVFSAMWVLLQYFAVQIGRYVLPHPVVLLPLLMLAGLALFVRRVKVRDAVRPENAMLVLLAAVSTLIAFLPTSAGPYFRYLTPVIPMACLLVAVITDSAMRLHWTLGVSVVIATAVLGNARGYVYEITHDFRGPIEGIVTYLNAHGSPNDVVATNQESLPLMFYTRMKVINGNSGEDLSPVKDARWVVIRQYANEDEAKVFEYMAKNIPWDRYRMVTLDVPDTVSQNREDPEKHYFETQLESPVVIYKRTK